MGANLKGVKANSFWRIIQLAFFAKRPEVKVVTLGDSK